MKLFNYVIMSALITTGFLCAQDKNGPGFAVKNESKEPIWVTVINGQDEVGSVEKLNPGQESARSIPERNRSFFTYLIIWGKEPVDFKIEREQRVVFGGGATKEVIIDKETIFRAINPSANYIYTFAKDRPIYVTWDKNKKLIPQRTSQYPLKNNVKYEADIILLYKNLES